MARSGMRPRGGLVDGRYELFERLGGGATGVVYRGEDRWLGRHVAVKMIASGRARDALYAALLTKSARALAQVRHENVVQVHALGPHARSFYVTMEYVAGTSLVDLLAERTRKGARLELPRALGIAQALARGLAAVHARGLVHRDVKPSNVLVEERTGRSVLVDFGLALTGAAGAGRGPAAAASAGTPAYMAPELASGDDAAVCPRTDVYALGCTTYELLTGRPAFGDSLGARRTVPRLSAHQPALASLDAVLVRALSKSPGDRQPSCAAFLEELEAAASAIVAREHLRPRGAPLPPGLRVVILETDEALRRQVVRIVDGTLRRPGEAVEIEHVTSVAELGAACRHEPPHIVLVDADSTAGATAGLLRGIAEAAAALNGAPEVLVLRRSLEAAPWTLEGLRAREIPKPVNAEVLASVLTQMATRMAERLR